jgi:hypothetical protein
MNARREQLDRSPTEALPNVGLTHESEHLPCTSPCPLSANSAPLPKSVLRGSLVLPKGNFAGYQNRLKFLNRLPLCLGSKRL